MYVARTLERTRSRWKMARTEKANAAWGRGLAVSASANSAETPRLVETPLFSLRSEEPPVSQLAKDAGPLHLGLEPLQELIAVFSITECYVCQFSLFSKNESGALFGAPN